MPKPFPCCACCPDDLRYHEANPPDSHDVPCDGCSAREWVAEFLPEAGAYRYSAALEMAFLAGRREP